MAGEALAGGGIPPGALGCVAAVVGVVVGGALVVGQAAVVGVVA